MIFDVIRLVRRGHNDLTEAAFKRRVQAGDGGHQFGTRAFSSSKKFWMTP